MHVAAQKTLGCKIAQHQVRIGDGCVQPAPPITGRPGVGAGTLRSNPHQPEVVHGGDGAATCARFDHLYDGDSKRNAAPFLETIDPGNLEFSRAQGLAIIDQASLGGGAAHVETKDVAMTSQLADHGSCLHATGRPRLHQPDRMGHRGGFVDRTTIRQHQIQILVDAHVAQPIGQASHIALEYRQHVRIADGGVSALVLADFRHYLAGDTYDQIGCFSMDDVPHAALMRRVAKSVQQRNRHGIDAG